MFRATKSSKPSFTAGLDGIHSFLVKDCAYVLAQPLTNIFDQSLKSEKFPALWKTAKIVPVYKSRKKSNCENYRPIALIPNFAKVFETAILPYINNSIKSILSEWEHGCIPHKSTVTNLACFKHYMINSMERGKQVDVVYLDFSKAFDAIDHQILKRKLNSLNL